MTADAVAIFGGSFNPVHWGHVRLAETIQRLLHFNPLWIVPSQNPPHKAPYAVSREQRLEMVRLAFASVPNTRISTFEMDSGQTSYAMHTIRHFRAQYGDTTALSFVMGADAFCDLPQWYAFPEVMEACSYLVVTRKGWGPAGAGEQAPLDACLGELQAQGLLAAEPAAEPFRRLFRTRAGTRVGVVEADLPDVSSTGLRRRMQAGESIEGFVPDAVARYLKLNRIYDKQEHA